MDNYNDERPNDYTEIIKDSVFIGEFPFESIKSAGEKTGIQPSSISDVCNNIKYHHTAGGYKWRYAD